MDNQAGRVSGGTIPLIINGRDVITETRFPVISPISTSEIWECSAASSEHVEKAISSAQNAFQAWAATKPSTRRDIFLRAAEIIAERRQELGEYMHQEIGADTAYQDFILGLAIEGLKDTAGKIAGALLGEIPVSNHDGMRAMTYKRPFGVVLGIGPWNAPYHLGFRAVTFALAAGNTTILKGPELSPRCYWAIADVFRQAGLPDGCLNLIFHRPEDAGPVTEQLVDNVHVRKINFTGSSHVGSIIAALAGKHLKPCLMELGGKASAIIFPDADLDKAAMSCAMGSFMNAGQICMSTERILVHSSVAAAFQSVFGRVISRTFEGPSKTPRVITAGSAKRNRALVAQALSKGGEILHGGSIATLGNGVGTTMPPVILTKMTKEMDLYGSESFGPSVSLFTFDTEDEAVELANDTRYGLSAAVFTEDLRLALRIADRLESGAVHINSMTVHDEFALPHGGIKNMANGEAAVATTIKLKPVASNVTGTVSDIVEVEEANNVEVNQNFNALSTLSLAVSLMATWETVCSTIGSGLVSGGPVSLVYGFILSFLGNLCTALSLGELASMYPTAGGQYHFVAELSSLRTKAACSWVSGWLTVLAWLFLTASAPFGAGTLIQGLLTLNYPEYVPQRWHGTMLYWAVLVVGFLVNLYGARLLPHIENLMMALHVLLFFLIFVSILALSPTRNSAAFVFGEFQNNTGWGSDGIAWSLGMVTSAYVMVGYDSATHLSEEMKTPRVTVPRAMVGSLVINASMGFALLIGILFCMGDLREALNTNTGFPIIQIFYHITGGSLAGTSASTCAIILSASGATIGLMASTSRTLWAFARDGAPPFSPWLSQISPRFKVPTNSVICVFGLLAILGLLNIASTTAFTAVLSLTVESLALSYLNPIVMLMYRRIRSPEDLVYGPWKLPGMISYGSGIVAILYNSYICIFLLFPPFQPVTAQNMNYAGVVLGGVLLLVAIRWFAGAHKSYNGPQTHL